MTAIDDSETENDETVELTLTPNAAAYSIGESNIARVTIVDNDLPVLTIKSSTASITEAGTTTGQFIVTRMGTTSPPLTANYALGGTAKNGTDYQTLSGSVAIEAGSSSASIEVIPIDDGTYKGSRTVRATLQSSSQYKLGSPDNATIAIKDDDLPVVTMSVPDAIAAAPDNTGRIRIKRDGATSTALTVRYSSDSGTAQSGLDYTPLSGTAVIPKGSSTVDIVITALANTERLDNKTVVLALDEDSAYRIGAGSSKTVTILGNNLPTVTVKAAIPKASETGPKAGKFTITRTGATGSGSQDRIHTRRYGDQRCRLRETDCSGHHRRRSRFRKCLHYPH